MIPEVMTDRWCSFARLNFQTHKCLLLPTWCIVCRLALVINIYCSLDVKLLSTTCSIKYVVGLHFDQVHFKELVSAMSIIFLLFLLQWNDSIHTKKLKKKPKKNTKTMPNIARGTTSWSTEHTNVRDSYARRTITSVVITKSITIVSLCSGEVVEEYRQSKEKMCSRYCRDDGMIFR